MWIVRLALNRPYTIAVMAALIILLGLASILTMPKDIFPDIDIPVVSVIWTYRGMTPQEFERRITNYSEYSLSNNVNGIEHIESQTLPGRGVVRLYFHPGTDVPTAVSQATAISQAILYRMPPGIYPPIILRFSASSVPIIQFALSGENQTESQLYDFSQFRMRQQIAAARCARSWSISTWPSSRPAGSRRAT